MTKENITTESNITREQMIQLLNEDLAGEYQAIIAYTVYSQVLKGAAYTDIARELETHAGEELAHANKILKHLADRDVVPKIGAVPAPVGTFKLLIEVAQAAYDFERANTAGIHAAYEAALAEKDYPAQVLLHWFISEQVEEEAWSDKLLVKTREAACAGALMNLDRHLEKILSGDATAS